jgi:hypothetical protein
MQKVSQTRFKNKTTLDFTSWFWSHKAGMGPATEIGTKEREW